MHLIRKSARPERRQPVTEKHLAILGTLSTEAHPHIRMPKHGRPAGRPGSILPTVITLGGIVKHTRRGGRPGAPAAAAGRRARRHRAPTSAAPPAAAPDIQHSPRRRPTAVIETTSLPWPSGRAAAATTKR